MWEKQGLLIAPDSEISWLSTYCGACFVFDNSNVLYLTGRNSQNQSEIGTFEICQDVDGRLTLEKPSISPIFRVGELGTFDQDGVSYPWLLNFNQEIHLFYVGWYSGGRTRFQNFAGRAISQTQGDGFNKRSKVPLIDRTDEMPYGSGSSCVVKIGDYYYLYYTSFVGWIKKDNVIAPSYNIKFTRSRDLINWEQHHRTAIDFEDEFETIIGKPMVRFQSGKYMMWYSYRGEHYKIGLADSTDGILWQRKDSEVGIDVSKMGWDSEMIEYAHVFELKNHLYMFYNGNGYGKSGLGYAIWREAHATE